MSGWITFQSAKLARVDQFSVGVDKLRDGLLWHSLRVLADGRAGAEIKRETMGWMMSDDIHPFSFVVCCAQAGYDPSGIREGVESILNRLARVKVGG